MLIDKELSIPLYKQIKDYIERKVEQGEWSAGYQLPTEKELAEQFHVSTITVKRAILDLVNDGSLYRQSGKGTFVSTHMEYDLAELVTMQDGSAKNNHPHKTVAFSVTQVDNNIAKILHLHKGNKVIKIHRLKLQNKKPIVIEYSYINEKLVPMLKQAEIENDLLYNVFSKKYGLQLDKAKVYISTMKAAEEEAQLLNVEKGHPLFVLERHTTVKEKEVIEYSKMIMLFEEAHYYLEVKL